MKLIDTLCQDCGVELKDVYPNRKYCTTCGAIRKKAKQRKYVRDNREKENKRKRAWEKKHGYKPCKGHCGEWVRKNSRSGYCRACSPFLGRYRGSKGREWDYSTI